MQTAVFLLLCFSCAHCGFSAGTALHTGDNDRITMLASLLLSEGNPQASVSVAGLPKVSGQLKTSLKKQIKGLPISVPVKFDGGKVTTGLDVTVKGVKVAIPLSFLARELSKVRLGKLKRSDLKKAKGVVELPSGLQFSYPEGIIKYPLKFDYEGIEFKIPFSTSVSKLSDLSADDIKPDSISAKLKPDLSFNINDQTVDVPLQFDGEKVTSGLQTKIKGVKFALPISFLLSSLAQISLGKLAKASHLKKLKAELDTPVEVTASGLPVKVPLSWEAGKLSFPLKLDLNGWSLAVPLSSGVSQVNGKLQSSLSKTVGGVPVEVPIKFDGEKVTSALVLTVKGVKAAIPVTFHIRELAKLRPGKLKLHHVKKVKADFEHPSGFGHGGLIHKWKEYTVKYPVKFQYQGMAFELPFSTSVSKIRDFGIDGITPGSVTGKLESPLSFNVNDLKFQVPVKLEGEKVTATVSTKVKGVKLSFPISFFLRSLSNLSLSKWRDFAKLTHLKKLKAELDSPLELDASGTPVTIPFSYEAGEVKYPLKFNVDGWSFEVPLSYNVAGATDDDSETAN